MFFKAVVNGCFWALLPTGLGTMMDVPAAERLWPQIDVAGEIVELR
jgi:hypothetical protein